MGKINEDKQITLEIIERWLHDDDCDVRVAAMNACQGREVPIIRTFEPPEKVYKKCAAGFHFFCSKDEAVRYEA